MPWTDVTVPLVIGVAAFAVQISAVPNCALERTARFQVRPAPEIASVCFSDKAVGPADVANRTSSSFALVVLNAGVVTVPVPSTETVLSIVSAAVVPGGPVDTSSETELPFGTAAPAFGL